MISSSLSNKDISELKFAVNNVKTQYDILLAPFAILMSERPKRQKTADGTVAEVWKGAACKVLSDIHFKTKLPNFDKDNIKEETMLEAFEYLNREAFDDEKVLKVNYQLYKLVNWC